jgi:poly(A) polymerase
VTAPQSQCEFALAVVQQLRDAGFEALWAGGCVRDQLLGREPEDYDVATAARPDQVRQLFGQRRTLAIGAAFGVIAVLGRRPLEPIEVATYRSDGRYLDGRRPESVAFTDAEHDAQRRDFTVNGLFYDPLAERVIDYVGGVADLEARVIRAIGNARERFADDKLRMLRAVRFAATLDFALDPVTLAAIQAMAGDATAVSGERTGAEVRRVLMHDSRRRGMQLMAEAKLLDSLLPELAPHAASQAVAWRDSLDRLTRLEAPTLPLAFAALLYGMADPSQARAIGRRFRWTNREIDRAAWLLTEAPAMLTAAELPWPRLQRLLAHDGAAELLALAASILPPDDPGLARCRNAVALPSEQWNPPPLVTGDDLRAAGMSPGRYFAPLLDHLRDEQLEGRLHNREEALAEAHRWAARTLGS